MGYMQRFNEEVNMRLQIGLAFLVWVLVSLPVMAVPIQHSDSASHAPQLVDSGGVCHGRIQ